MNLLVVLLAYDFLQAVMHSFFGADGVITSPFWFVLEGAIVGLLVDGAATRYGGEGPGTVTREAAGIVIALMSRCS